MNPPQARYAINVIETDDGKLLFLKRSTSKDLGPGQWGFCAGHIETNESPEQCAIRELHEELGPAVEVELIQSFGPVRDTLYGGSFEIWLFHHRYLNGDLVLNEEHSEFRWVPRSEYRDLDVMDGIDEDLVYLGIWQ